MILAYVWGHLLHVGAAEHHALQVGDHRVLALRRSVAVQPCGFHRPWETSTDGRNPRVNRVDESTQHECKSNDMGLERYLVVCISRAGPPDQGLVQGDQGGVDRHGDDREVEVVEHNVDLLVDAFLEAKVQTKNATADALERALVL